MALAPIALFSDPMEDYPANWVKAYEQGTTTPLAMAIDSTGSPTVAKAEISSGGVVPIGFLKTAGDAIFIPYIGEAYDLWLFPTEAEADANDTSSAIQLADDGGYLLSLANSTGGVLIANMIANTALNVGDFVSTVGYISSGDGGDNSYEIVAAGTGTDDGGSYIDLTGSGFQAKGLFPKGVIRPQQFGAIPDGVTDTYEELGNVAAFLSDNTKVDFGDGVYLIEYGGGYSGGFINGVTAFPIKDVKNVEIAGNKATIKIANHNITTNNGLTVFTYDGCQNLSIHGFVFELSYTGRNDSATYYPFNGAIYGVDTTGVAGSRTGDQLSSGIDVYDNVFDIYHPLGCYAEAVNTFPGDPNNGFKVFSFTALGDNLATDAVNQNFDVDFHHNRFLSTHNAYGCWVWAYNNYTAVHNKASLWANYATDSAGVDNGKSISMLRYHQFYNTGADVSHNTMTPRALADRTGGYQGRAIFNHFTQNLAVDIDTGESICSSNTFSLRTADVGIFVNLYGTVNIYDNIINGIDVTDRPTAGIDISTSENGKAYYNIKGNTANRKFSAPFVRIDNGAALKEDRRLKVLNIKENEVLNYYTAAVFGVNTSGSTTQGVELIYCDDNTFDGVASEFSIANSNGAAFGMATSTEVTDTYYITDNIVRSFYNLELSGTATAKVYGNDGDTITSSTNHNYLPPNLQTREIQAVVNPDIPRVGVSNVYLYSYTAKLITDASGVVNSTSYGEVGGGSSIGGATPAGQTWYIDRILIGQKGLV